MSTFFKASIFFFSSKTEDSQKIWVMWNVMAYNNFIFKAIFNSSTNFKYYVPNYQIPFWKLPSQLDFEIVYINYTNGDQRDSSFLEYFICNWLYFFFFFSQCRTKLLERKKKRKKGHMNYIIPLFFYFKVFCPLVFKIVWQNICTTSQHFLGFYMNFSYLVYKAKYNQIIA